MLSLTIKDTKNFMSQLLIKEAFDGLFLSEAVIKTANSYTISGELNKDFFSEEEWNELPEKSYCDGLLSSHSASGSSKAVRSLPI